MCLNRKMMGEGISLSDSICLKGIATIGVFCSHIGSFLNITINPKIDVAVGMLGYLFVGVFFFLSGYGLHTQFKKKGKEYIKKIPVNKLVPLYIIEIICIAIYLLFDIITKQKIKLSTLFYSFLFGDSIISNGWYLQVAIVMYAIYYFSVVSFNSPFASRCAFTTLILLYMFVCPYLHLLPTWYQSVPMFLIGVLSSEYLDSFVRIINTNGIGLISLIVFVIIVTLRSIDSLSSILIILTILSELVWIIIVLKIMLLLTSHKISRYITCLGYFSLEIYIFQGLAFRFSKMISNNRIISLGISIIIVLGISYILHPLFQYMKKAIKNSIPHKQM